jgi:aspartyl-tRNA(Asn)/glutamyl-tRNA(Gln) amidotransferase subunit C
VSVSRDQAERIAHLARLRFDEEELDRLTAELNHILDYVESLRGLEAGPGGSGHLATAGAPTVESCAPTRGPGAERPDELRRDLEAMAPEWRDGFFVVPPLPGVHEGEEA